MKLVLKILHNDYKHKIKESLITHDHKTSLTFQGLSHQGAEPTRLPKAYSSSLRRRMPRFRNSLYLRSFVFATLSYWQITMLLVSQSSFSSVRSSSEFSSSSFAASVSVTSEEAEEEEGEQSPFPSDWSMYFWGFDEFKVIIVHTSCCRSNMKRFMERVYFLDTCMLPPLWRNDCSRIYSTTVSQKASYYSKTLL